MAELSEALGISIDKATQQLKDEGAEKFIKPFGGLMRTPAKPSWRWQRGQLSRCCELHR